MCVAALACSGESVAVVELSKQSATIEGKARSIATSENKLGQLESYTDADGNTSTYEYDSDERPTHTSCLTLCRIG
jgi:YD repeat-containing protein